MSKMARYLVSQKKKRTVDKNVPKGSVDLDLTEIHERIVCMGYPATGVEALYRNSYEDSLRYLDHKYGEDYMVYNLCGEKAYQYSLDRFHGRVRAFPFMDHQACPLKLMPEFVKDARAWIEGGPKRVVVIHCKAGKGRTGIMACCLLLDMEPSLHGSATATMQYYGKMRTQDGRGLTVPSQRRSVVYYERLRNEFGGEAPERSPVVTIQEIRLVEFAPRVSVHWLYLYNDRKTVALHLKDIRKDETLVKASSTFKVTESGLREDVLTLDCRHDPQLAGFSGDVKLVIKDGNGTVGVLSINTLFMHKRYDSNGVDKLNKKFDPKQPCAIEFDFVVTEGVCPETPPPSPSALSLMEVPHSDGEDEESEEEEQEETGDQESENPSSSPSPPPPV